ncbi:MAG: hypothetical protein GX444_20240 [Myxococcales bacterium]|nr:hypothetical protein [Myxococcales bacterium]
MSEENTEKRSAPEAPVGDWELETDIKHLKRSSNFLAVLGLLIIVLFIGLLGMKIRQSIGEGNKVSIPKFLDVGTVSVETATVFEQPLPTAGHIGELQREDAVFIIEDKPKDWFRVHAVMVDGGNRRELDGWVRKEQIRTRTELKQLRKDLATRESKSLDITDVNWTIDEVGNYTISGKVFNLTDVPLRNIKVIITFYDKDNNAVEQRYTYVASDSPLTKRNPIPFAFIGKNEKTFNFVNCRADYRFSEE